MLLVEHGQYPGFSKLARFAGKRRPVLSPSRLAARLDPLKHGFFAGEAANSKNIFDGTKLSVVVCPPLHHKIREARQFDFSGFPAKPRTRFSRQPIRRRGGDARLRPCRSRRPYAPEQERCVRLVLKKSRKPVESCTGCSCGVWHRKAVTANTEVPDYGGVCRVRAALERTLLGGGGKVRASITREVP